MHSALALIGLSDDGVKIMTQQPLPLVNAALFKAQAAAKKTLLDAEKERLIVAHPELTPIDPAKYNGLITAAKNIRIQLKNRWPHVKFSVRTERFSMGNAIDVRWTDGPTVKMVDAIVNQYSAGKFDGMTDCYDYHSTGWTEAFGSAKYVHTHRDFSANVTAWAKQNLKNNNSSLAWHQKLDKLSIIRTK